MKKHYLIIMLFAASCMMLGCSKSSKNPTPSTTGSFKISGTDYSGSTTAIAAISGGNGMDVTINGGGNNYLVLYNVPTASSGTTSFADGNNAATLSGTNLYALSTVNVGQSTNGSTSKSGTLNKTGARSFTFTCVMQTAVTGGTTTTITGSGSY